MNAKVPTHQARLRLTIVCTLTVVAALLASYFFIGKREASDSTDERDQEQGSPTNPAQSPQAKRAGSLNSIGSWNGSAGAMPGGWYSLTNLSRQFESLAPSTADAGIRSGMAAWRSGDFAQAGSNFTSAILADPGNGIAFLIRGAFRSDSGDFAGAIEDMNAALRLIPRATLNELPDARALLFGTRGSARVWLNQSEDAITDLTEAIRLDPTRIELLLARGVAFNARTNFSQAIADLDEYLRRVGPDANAHSCRGNSYVGLGEFAKAEADYSEAIRLQPSNPRHLYNRGLARTKQEKWEEAIVDLSKSIRIDPSDHRPMAYRAEAHWRLGRLALAISDYSAALQIAPRDPWLRYARGSVYEENRAWQEAAKDFAEVVRLSPQDSEAHNALAWLLATCPTAGVRDAKQGVELAQKACELSNWSDWRFIDTLAAAHAEAGNFGEAIKRQHQALEAKDITEADRKEMQERLSLYQQQQPYRVSP